LEFANKPLAASLLQLQLGFGSSPAKTVEAVLDHLLTLRRELQSRTVWARGLGPLE
jgi:hypothetical protein